MPRIEAVVGFLDKEEALQPGESPWRTYEEEDELREVNWRRLFPPRRRQDRAETLAPWTMEDDWHPDFEGRFVDEVIEAAQGEEPLPGFGDKEGGRQPGGQWDTCAWYQPIHYFAYDWGIFIREECILKQATMIARFLDLRGKPVSDTRGLAKALVRASLHAYFLHEQYHHKVECLGLRLHVVERKSAYLPYQAKVYRAAVGTDDLLEEALANADAFRRLKTQPYAGWFSRPVLKATRRFLRWRFPLDPPGYRQAAHYLRAARFATGENRLHGQVHEALLKPCRTASDWDMAPRLMQSFFPITSNIWSVVRGGQQPFLPFNTSLPVRTCSTSDMVRLFERRGYQEVSGGKGSHVKMKKPGSPTMILPGNRRSLSPGVARTALKALGDHSIADLPRLLVR